MWPGRVCDPNGGELDDDRTGGNGGEVGERRRDKREYKKNPIGTVQEEDAALEANVLASILSKQRFPNFRAVLLVLSSNDVARVYIEYLQRKDLCCPVIVTTTHSMLRLADHLARDHKEMAGIIHHADPIDMQTGSIGLQWYDGRRESAASEDALVDCYTTLCFGHRDLAPIQTVSETKRKQRDLLFIHKLAKSCLDESPRFLDTFHLVSVYLQPVTNVQTFFCSFLRIKIKKNTEQGLCTIRYSILLVFLLKFI